LECSLLRVRPSAPRREICGGDRSARPPEEGEVVVGAREMEETATAAPAEKASSYRYWVREKSGDAAPLPAPRKLDPAAATANGSGNGNPPPLGSVWNQVG
jgi:hypothetical protein